MSGYHESHIAAELREIADGIESGVLIMVKSVQRGPRDGHRVLEVTVEPRREVTPRAHIAHDDSLEAFGTGHPSEKPCAMCGKPTWDLWVRYESEGKPYCCPEHIADHHRQPNRYWTESRNHPETGREYSIACSYLQTPLEHETLRVAAEAACGAETARPLVKITTPEEWRAHFGKHSTPPSYLTDAQPMVLVPAPLYAGDGHPALRALADQTGSYENTEDPE